MAVVGQPRIIEDKHLFEIRIKGVTHAGFQKCSEISWEFDTIVYREGSSLIASAKDPGLLNFDPVTLERGAVSADSDLYDWSKEVANAATNTGLENPKFKRTVDLVIKNRAGGREVIWRLYNAWPKRTSIGDRDNEASEKVIASTVLEYDYAKRIKV